MSEETLKEIILFRIYPVSINAKGGMLNARGIQVLLTGLQCGIKYRMQKRKALICFYL
ncbi:hypothetical protein EMIT0P294_20340 [Pseudomonas sp. IT-P294]